MNPDNQVKARDSHGRWVKGTSGNLNGRPKGKTMKEWAKDYLARMTDEERDEFMDGIPKEIIWKMGEGMPSQGIGQADDLEPIPLLVKILDDKSNGATG